MKITDLSTAIRLVDDRVEWHGAAMHERSPHRAANPTQYIVHASRTGVEFQSVDGSRGPVARLTDTERLLALEEMVLDMAATIVALANEEEE